MDNYLVTRGNPFVQTWESEQSALIILNKCITVKIQCLVQKIDEKGNLITVQAYNP